MNESDFFLVELRVLMQKNDLDLINYLKEKNNVSEDELRSVGAILIQSLRGFC